MIEETRPERMENEPIADRGERADGNDSRENKIRRIEIEQLGYGYLLHIGCQKIAIEKSTTLIEKLSAYIMNPNETEEKYRNGTLMSENYSHEARII